MLQYLITATTYMAVLYIAYILLLSNDTHYTRNRAYLIISLTLSLVLPLIRLNIAPSSTLAGFQGDIAALVDLGTITVTPANNTSAWFYGNIPLVVYLGGVVFSLSISLFYIARIYGIIRQGRTEGSNKIYTDFNNISGFSAFGYIFLSNELEGTEEHRIEEHEQKHIDHKHFADLVYIRIIQIIFWFNPFVYLYTRSIKAIHEYQADAKMIDEGENPLSYTRLIMNQVFRTKLFTIENAFANKTLIKKRIIMMTKRKTRSVAGLKLLLILPLTGLLFFVFSCAQEEANPVYEESKIEAEKAAPENNFKSTDKFTEKEIFIVVEEMPTFQGGDVRKFRDWVQRNVLYPKIAAENGIQGKVFIMFVVEPDGSVTNAEIMRGVDPVLDNEALRVVNESPLWVPGKQRDEAVRVRFSITVNFQLE